jgi:hypothetical protein
MTKTVAGLPAILNNAMNNGRAMAERSSANAENADSGQGPERTSLLVFF